MILVIALAVSSLCAGLGWYVAGEKGRPGAEGLVLGALFGPLGVLVAALLPSVPVRPHPSASGRSHARVVGVPEYRDDWDDPLESDPDEADDERVMDYLNGLG